MIETKIGPKIKPKNPKIFNPKIIPKTVLRGWMFSNFFKKVNLKRGKRLILKTPDGEIIIDCRLDDTNLFMVKDFVRYWICTVKNGIPYKNDNESDCKIR